MTALVLALASVAAATAPDAPFPPWLDTSAIGADAFRKAHPEWDGRGVAIAVLDTGVDMGAPGLGKTSNGEVKVVEARDFTGETVVECDPATVEKDDKGQEVWRAKGSFVQGVRQVAGLPEGAPVWLGFLDESKFKNTAVTDLNGNGRTDDRFAVLLFQGADKEWRVAIDRAADHDLAGDAAVLPYAKGREPVTLAGQDPSRATPPIRLAVHVDAASDGPKKVEFHIPAGSHGTHVAGIAAGYRLNGIDGYDGVAPGAVVLSLKVGNNGLGGGASVTESMKKALEFAGRWGREHRMPVVVNMSYGVGSELEGQADIDAFVDRFAEENPHVVPVFSAGNDGPGLSTVGSPAAALHALAVAAAYTPAMAKTLIGATVPSDRLFQFSARGGELAKPDVAAPGMAASTVPAWERNDLMRGTSMAAPQAAGAAALVLSATVARDPAARWCSGLLRRSLRDTARPIKGYGPLDQGGGMLDVARAAAGFRERLAEPDAATLMGLEVQTTASTLVGRKARAAFWRAGGWAPTEDRPATVTLKARFAADTPGPARAAFWRSLSLSADAGWVNLSKGSVRLKGDSDASFDLWVDADAVRDPGVHVATVTAKAGSLRVDFPVTVVAPYPPKPIDGVPIVRLRGLRLDPSDVLRFPLAPPAGTSLVSIEVAPARDRKAQVAAYVFDPQGRRVAAPDAVASSEKGTKAEIALATGDLLEPGTLELVLHAPPTVRHASEVDLDVRYLSLAAEPIRSLNAEPGQPPKTRVTVTNGLPVPFAGAVRGAVAGCERTFRKSLGADPLREGFHLSPEYEGVEIELRMSPEDWSRFTDVAIAITDRDGRDLFKGGFDTRVARLTFRNPDPAKPEGDFTLVVTGGRALSGSPSAELEIRVRHVWKDRVALVGTGPGGGKEVELYPSVSTPVEIKAASTPRSCPGGSSWAGSVEFENRKDDAVWLRLPVIAKP
jgi:subtilisin family serine protease